MNRHKMKRTSKLLSRRKQKGIKIVGKWKPVALDPSMFADEKFEEIVCFEELTDYELVKSSKEITTKELKRKHKAIQGGDLEESREEQEETVKVKKRKKQNEMAKPKKQRKHTDSEDEVFSRDEDDLLDVDETTSHEEPAEKVVKPNKKRKAKKRKSKKSDTHSDNPPPPTVAKKVKNWASASSSSKNVDVSAWKNLCVPKLVLKALSVLGFSAPTPIQALSLPAAIRDRMDILGAAETGSGKTLAFAIPMIHSILEWKKNKGAGGTDEEQTPSHNEHEVESPTMDENQNVHEDEDDGSSNEEEVQSTVYEEENPMREDDESSTLGELDENDEADCTEVVIADLKLKPQTWDRERPLLGLVVTPTRELAIQVKHHIDAVAQFTGVRTAVVVGGMALQKQKRVLSRRPEIVIATPGRLWELIREKQVHLTNLQKLRCLVIDEADRMVEKGHYAELSQLLEMLTEVHFTAKRQTFVFSATLTLIHQAPSRLLQKKRFKKMDKDDKLESLMQKIGMRAKPKVIDLTRKQATVETLTETKIHCTSDDKDFYLYYFLLQYPGRTMVFANSIDCIKRLCSLLTILECNPLTLHANMHQKQRLKNLERFAERESCVLLTTDVAARGLDIPNVQHVLHYQVPRTSETYVHRSGRTARVSSDGLSLLLIGPDDVPNFKKICRTLDKNEDLPFFPVQSNCMTGIRERVNLARQIEKIEYFNSKAKHQNSWIQQAAEALEIDLDDDDLIGEKDEQEEKDKRKMLQIMKKQLKRLLSQPIFKNIMKTKYPTQTGKLDLPTLLPKSESALQTISKNSKT
uniref:ATP-dependent RNA helicase n=1 Tax=Leptobrachium leishanense TaxID=445787 RepID=A0A8C5R2F8_9ANUR